MYLKSALEERFGRYVDNGIAYFDKHFPLWWRDDVPNAVNLDTLDMSSASRCVLAQCTGDFYHDAKVRQDFSADRAVTCGLCIPADLSFVDQWVAWGILTDRWRSVIIKRREALAQAAKQQELLAA